MAGDAADIEKRLRAVRKKLGQIDKLKEKNPSELDDAAREKVAAEVELKAEERDLEQQLGEASPSGATSAAAPAAPAAPAKAKAKATPSPPAAGGKSSTKAAPATPAEVDDSANASSSLSPMEREKRVKNIRKKLQQIQKLKERVSAGEELDSEALEKVAGEAEFLREIAALEAGEEYVPPAKPPPKQQQQASADGDIAEAELGEQDQSDKDPHAQEREEALAPPPGDIGLLIDDETEKRFKALQKKLREIGKLHEKDKLEKLQQEKLKQEPGLIEELKTIHAQAQKLVEERRARMSAPAASAQADKFEPKPRKSGQPSWQCNECGAVGGMGDLIGGDGALACNKCGGTSLKHSSPGGDDDDDEDDAEGAGIKKPKNFESKDLKTKRQKAQPLAKKLDDGVMPTPESAKWPEVKDILESGDRGVDKSRQKKAIEVSKAKAGAPYDVFDSTLLKCSFLTRVELKLPPGVLSSEAFQLYFPGSLKGGLLELILKENDLAMVPLGIAQLQRIRSLDLSHNKIEALPDEDAWASIADSLELLDLSFNKLGSIQQLAPLNKLSQLKVDANQLTSLDGISWGNLKQLSMLSAVGNELAAIPEAVKECSGSLEYLELSENKLVALPVAVCDLKKIKTLNVAGNPIKDQKTVKAAEKGIKDLKAYLSKIGGSKGKK